MNSITMKTITNILESRNKKLMLLGVAVVLFAVFVALPQFPQVRSGLDAISLRSNVASADVDLPQPSCPFAPEANRTIVEFNDRLRSNGSLPDAFTGVEGVSLQAGTYEVQLASWDGYTGREEVSQPNERWRVLVYNGSSLIEVTGAIRDVPDNVRESLIQQKVNSALVLDENATQVVGKHIAYPDDSSANSVNAICVAFDRAPDPEPEKPTCSIDADPASIEKGNTTTLTWTTTNANTVSIDNGVSSTDFNGSEDVSPNTNTTYTLTATGDGGEVTCNDTLTVIEPGTPSISITKRDDGDKDDTQTIDQGGTATFEVIVENTGDIDLKDVVVTDPLTSSCDKNIGLLGANTSYSYTCTATNVQNDFTNTANVTGKSTEDDSDVNDSDDSYVVVSSSPPAPTCTLNADPSAIQSGGSSELEWTTTNANTVSIDQGIGAVDANATTSVSPTSDTTYTLTAVGDGGEITCSDVVTIREEGDPSCDSFTSSASSVNSGEEFTLTWETTNATEVSIDSGVGIVGLDGFIDHTIGQTTTFTLRATDGETEVTCDTTVKVTTGGGGGGSSSPRCDFEASKTKINAGEDVVLTWDNTRTNDILIEDNRGNVLIDTENNSEDKDIDEDEGSITVSPTKNTTYTLNAIRGSKERKCPVTITMDSGVSVSSSRSQDPLVAGISLTNVPYTGFEAGPMLTTIFYLLLIAWSLGIAYILVIRKESVLGFQIPTSTLSEHMVEGAEETQQESTEDSFREQVAPVPSNLPTASNFMPTVGYAPQAETEEVIFDEEETEGQDEMVELENRAHESGTLLSSDAIRFILNRSRGTTARLALLDEIIQKAKASYPSEDGWVVVNRERITALSDGDDATDEVEVKMPTPNAEETEQVGASSLAEAIVTGNVVSAYQMLGKRPLFALADAVQDLDALYRSRKGEHVIISDMLARASKDVADQGLLSAIEALTTAIDGVYTDEASAVKLAIMKAVRAVGV